MKVYIKLYSEDNGILLDANKIYRDDENNILSVLKDNELVGVFSLPEIKEAFKTEKIGNFSLEF